VIAILIYTAARVGAVAKLRRADFYETCDQYCLRFHEKGGNVREIPVRHDLQRYADYISMLSGLVESYSPGSVIWETSQPLFHTGVTDLPLPQKGPNKFPKKANTGGSV
jgi:hypothetical protein